MSCFWFSGAVATGYSRCSNGTEPDSCCYQGEACLTSGLCYGSIGLVYLGACSDSTWTGCPLQEIAGIAEQWNEAWVNLYPCNDAWWYGYFNTSYDNVICGVNGTFVDLGNPGDVRAIAGGSLATAVSNPSTSQVSTSQATTSTASSAETSSANSSLSFSSTSSILSTALPSTTGIQTISSKSKPTPPNSTHTIAIVTSIFAVLLLAVISWCVYLLRQKSRASKGRGKTGPRTDKNEEWFKPELDAGAVIPGMQYFIADVAAVRVQNLP